MKVTTVNFDTGKLETYYRGARTTRYFKHMRPETILRLRSELNDIVHAGYAPKWVNRNEWQYTKGSAA